MAKRCRVAIRARPVRQEVWVLSQQCPGLRLDQGDNMSCWRCGEQTVVTLTCLKCGAALVVDPPVHITPTGLVESDEFCRDDPVILYCDECGGYVFTDPQGEGVCDYCEHMTSKDD